MSFDMTMIINPMWEMVDAWLSKELHQIEILEEKNRKKN